MADENRFLERFWSLYAANRIGVFRSAGGALAALVKIIGIVVGILAIFMLLLYIFPDEAAGALLTFALAGAIVGFVTYKLILFLMGLIGLR